MSLSVRAFEILREQGVRGLVRRTYSILDYKFEYFRKGGTSSRPQLEPFAGIFHPIYNTYFSINNGKKVDIMAEDWDSLILLDACRYDDFKKINPISGQLESRISAAVDSRQFVIRNFQDQQFHDTVYITANPHVDYLSDDVFYSIDDRPLDEFDPELGCVPPKEVTKRAIDSHQQYPKKRLIVHYMQPHDPPIGPTGNKIRERFDLAGPDAKSEERGVRIMEAVAKGSIPVSEARQAYRENLQIVLSHVRDLIDELDGKTVVSSDHGEMFGEKPYPVLGELYEHYNHPRTQELCQVPWFIVDDEDGRRNITTGEPISNTRDRNVDVEDQLEALGYA